MPTCVQCKKELQEYVREYQQIISGEGVIKSKKVELVFLFCGNTFCPGKMEVLFGGVKKE